MRIKQSGEIQEESKEWTERNYLSLFSIKQDKKLSCIFCEQDHESALCEKTKKMTYKDRCKIVKIKNACFYWKLVLRKRDTVTNITDIKTNTHDAVRDTYYLRVVTYRVFL